MVIGGLKSDRMDAQRRVRSDFEIKGLPSPDLMCGRFVVSPFEVRAGDRALPSVGRAPFEVDELAAPILRAIKWRGDIDYR